MKYYNNNARDLLGWVGQDKNCITQDTQMKFKII